MKKFMPVFAVLFVIAALLMVSCDKDVTPTSLSVNLLKKATIKGYVYAQLDLTVAGLEKAPAGTEVVISIPYNDLNSAASGNYKDTAVVNADGFFEVSVPVGNGTAGVTIIPLPFETNQTQPLGALESQVKKFYTGSAAYVNLTASAFQIIQINYSDNSYDNYVEMIQLSGDLIAELNDTSVGFEKAPAGIQLTFHGDGWNKVVSIAADGSYSIEVPANNSIFVDYLFTTDRVTFVDTAYKPVPYTYENEGLYIGSFSQSTKKVEINAGFGVPVK